MSSMSPPSGKSQGVLIVLTVVIIAVLAVGAVYLMQDHRTTSERLGDAVEAVPQGLDNAADKLGDQSPAKNVKDNVDKAVDKAGDKLQ